MGVFMFSKKMILVILIVKFFSFPMFSTTSGENDLSEIDEQVIQKDMHFGFSLGSMGFTSTSNIIGGYYLRSTASTILDNIMIDIYFDTNILSNVFMDKLLSINFQILIYSKDGFASSFGPTYLINVSNITNSNYFGLTFFPINSWNLQFEENFKMFLAILPFSIYYGFQTNEFLYSFNFIDFKFYF